ncbi:MAG: phosphoglucosamine mutase [Candidatus Hydrothermarchaeota archaeon]|nr:MAG: phosphoglucosamine mutase [Candidatus Hydrothermarchaeota archaeon]
MNSMEHIFRAYDIRGIANRELTPNIVAKIGLAYGTYLNGKARVLIGRDARTSSEVFEKAFIAGLASTGCDCYSAGLLPIPIVNFKIWKLGYDGAYITASHNPPEYNGIRFRHRDGSGYTKENREIKEIFLSNKFKLANWNNLGRIHYLDASLIIREYSDYLLNRINAERELNIVLDLGNGASCVSTPYIFREAGHRILTLNSQPDGTFPGRPSEPSEETLEDLSRAVKVKRADFGAGYDGDGDRVIFVDDKGRVVQTEKIGILICREILKKRKGVVIANISCSMIVEEEIEKLGGKVIRTRVGDVFIAEAIKKHNAIFAMETSAHFFMPEFYIFDDPTLVSLKLAEILSKENKKLSELVDEIPSYPMVTRNFPCDDRIKFKIVDKIIENLRKEGYTIDLTDGAKVIFDDAWALLRPSNTTPLIRACVEAKSNKRIKELLKFVERELRKAEKEVK